MVGSVKIPRMFYGTAWKESLTAELTQLALQSGFQAIDTANQRKHYDEAAVGQGIKRFLSTYPAQAESPLFLQTKFTFLAGQDHRLPYDPVAPIAQQVQQSFQSSTEHLNRSVIDSFVLHGPMYQRGLCQQDWEAWRAMEDLVGQKKVRLLGVSNVSRSQLELLVREATIRPSFVQNRCFASQGWNRDVRQFCREHGIIYQGFSLLTANRQIFADHQLKLFAQEYGCTLAQLIYSFALHLEMIVLTGTTQEQHMREALAAQNLCLSQRCVDYLENIAV